MKTCTLFLLALCLSFSSMAQTYFEDFEGFATTDLVAATSSHWRTYGSEYNEEADAAVVQDKAYSGKNSLFFKTESTNGGPTDLVLDLEKTYLVGTVNISFMLYVNESNAYFNFQGHEEDGEHFTMESYIGDSIHIVSKGEWQHFAGVALNQWVKCEWQADLTTGEWTLYVDEKQITVVKMKKADNRIAAVDFYPLNYYEGDSVSSYWLDDVSFTYTPYTFPNTNLVISNVTQTIEQLEGMLTGIRSTVENLSNRTINELTIEYTYGGQTYSRSVTGLQLEPNDQIDLLHSELLPLSASSTSADVAIKSFNSGKVDDDASDNTYRLKLNVVVPHPQKKVLIEEATGTWCGWCPRGEITLDYVEEYLTEYLIGAAYHSGDPMEIPYQVEALELYIFPSGQINRTVNSDMGIDSTLKGFYNEIVKAPAATMDAAARIQENQLEISVEYSFLSSVGKDWRVGCLLMENGVEGTDGGYNQANYYSGGDNGAMGGYENKPKIILAYDMVYDHVVRQVAPGVFGGIGFTKEMKKGDKETFVFSINLNPEWNTDQLYLIPVLLTSDTTIDNSNIIKLSDAINKPFVDGKVVAGVDKHSIQDWQVYPHPAHQQALIQFGSDEPRNVKIFNQQGQLVMEQNVSSSKTQLELDSLSPGIYVISVVSKGRVESKKLFVE